MTLQEDWIGTQSDQSESMLIKSTRRYSSTWCRRETSWSRHQKLQEDWIGTQGISINLCPLSL